MGERFQLHLITDRKRCAGDLLAAVDQAVASGVDWVQVREKTAPAVDVYELCRRVQRACEDTGAGLIVNDRVDVARAVRAGGVHLAKKSLRPAVARPLLAPDQILGCSVHSLDEAVRIAGTGVNYLTFGNVFPTDSHPGFPARGVEVLRAIVHAVNVPVLAIGGITVSNVGDVLATGCAGVAVIGAILGDPDPAGAARKLREALDAYPAQPRRPFPQPEGRTRPLRPRAT
jgi:thiamine-phosphate diphosphorylase